MSANPATTTPVMPKARKGREATGCEALFRQLVAHASEAPVETTRRASVSPVEASGEERVLLDYKVDGVRYVLARAQVSEVESSVTLSPREQEIVRMVAKGYPNKMVAAVLEISVWTVSTHLRRIFAKYGVNSRAAMVAKVLGRGL